MEGGGKEKDITGAAKVLTNDAAPAVILYVPMPFARISFAISSAG